MKKIKWTYDILKNEALKYKTNTEFKNGSPNAYAAACRNKWMKEICVHMEPLGHRFLRLVYVYEFPDNYAYVGLTYNKEKRHREHIRDGRGPVYRHIKKTGSNPEYKMVSDWYIPKIDAQELEVKTYEKYLNQGWKMINSAPCGNLGGNDFKYNVEYLESVAKRYNNRKDLKTDYPNVYSLIIQRKLHHLFNHMVWNGNNLHTLDESIEVCKKYNSIEELRKNNYDIYQWVHVHNYSDICLSHIIKKRKMKWDTNEAIEISKKYEYLDDFIKNDIRAYSHLKKKGYDFLSHLKRISADSEEFRKRISDGKKQIDFIERVCKTCGVNKPFSEFYGKRWDCKICRNSKSNKK
jgi:hypothetical protein